MTKKVKMLEVKRDAGWWVASTPAVDRDRDRMYPHGFVLDNYRKNPVIAWAHDYRSPFAVIGRAKDMSINESEFRIFPEWREPANDADPMHIIRALIDQEFVRAMSIGFNPIEFEANDKGGFDFHSVEILEVSVVPVPANQEALRLAAKALAGDTFISLPIDGAVGTVKTEAGVWKFEPATQPKGEEDPPAADEPPADPPTPEDPPAHPEGEPNTNDEPVPDPEPDTTPSEPASDGDNNQLSEDDLAAVLATVSQFVETISNQLNISR